ncbi:site-specific integrase [Variovorax sp. LjRoot175]|uniref:DUF6538 domain-containing protein n=1 Tax=Variovorax sp. LjRoot175 TaxID=3342276 RepID=UPI003ECEFD49
MAQPFRSKTGIYQLRRKVPAELRQALGYEYKRSLGTRDPAEAKARFAEEWARSEAAFALARAQARGADVLTERDMQQLAARWFRSELKQLEATGDFASWLAEGTAWTVEQGSNGQEHVELTTLRQALDEDPEWDLSGKIRESVKRALAAGGIPVPTDRAKASRLEAVFKEHWLKLSDLAQERHSGNWTAQPTVLEDEPLSVETKAPSSRPPKLLELFESYAAEKVLNDGDTRAVRKTIGAYRATVEQFNGLFGEVAAREIGRDMVRDYRSALSQLPASGDGIRGLSAKQLIAKAESEGLPRVSPQTVRNKLRALSAVLSHGVRMGHLSENPVTASGIAKAAAKAAGKGAAAKRKRKDYSKKELKLIFSSPIFSDRGWSPPRADFGKAWFWMPLLMYYTGARREELAQLAVRDVKTGGEGELIPYLSILEAADEDEGRGVKTEGSRRQIPLHPDLIERGFTLYVASLPAEGQVFPMLKPNPAGFFGANFGKRWASYLRDEIKLHSSASPSHGFRHTFKTLCREVGIPEDVHDAITGHAGSGAVARDYGSMPLRRMAEEIRRYPSIASVIAEA